MDKRKEVSFVEGGMPRHRIFQKSSYLFPFARHFRHATVTTMWGCPFACSYCPDSLFAPIVRHYENVVEELRHLESLGIKELFFADKVFGFPVRNVLPLLEEMTRSFNFSWSCYFHPQIYRENLLELMKSAGCHTIIIGIDTADPGALQRYNREVDRQKADSLVSKANRLGISVCADFILGLEHESEDDIRQTIEYALQLPIDFASFNIAAPFPGTDIRKKARESGKMTFGKEGYDSLSHKEDLGISRVRYDRIRRLRNQAVRKFYLRPAYLARRLRRTVSIEHFFIQFGQMFSMFRKI